MHGRIIRTGWPQEKIRKKHIVDILTRIGEFVAKNKENRNDGQKKENFIKNRAVFQKEKNWELQGIVWRTDVFGKTDECRYRNKM